MKTILLAFTVLSIETALAQGEVVFRVAAPASSHKIEMLPNVDTLMAGGSYHFEMNGLRDYENLVAVFSQGKVVMDSSELVIMVDSIIQRRFSNLQIFYPGDPVNHLFQHNFVVLPLTFNDDPFRFTTSSKANRKRFRHGRLNRLR